MKTIIIVMIYCMASFIANAQPPKKPPTPQELEAMKARARKGMEKLTPEQLKKMKEMGYDVSSLDGLDQPVKGKYVQAPQSPGAVPQKNAAKIASIPSTPTDAQMGSLLGRIQLALETKLDPQLKPQISELFQAMLQKTKEPRELGKGPVGLWLSGRPEMAVLLAGKVCQYDPKAAENINNFAAILNMMDAQHMALPLLENINRKYPGNATILANIGQAWFGLGEIKKAEKYLDSAIQRFPKHSQANKTKSEIQENRGDKEGAAESIKRSMETGYTEEKEEALRRLQYQESHDVPWPFHIPEDPLGFDEFELPPFPMNVEEAEKVLPKWEFFWKTMAEEQKKTEEEMVKLGNQAVLYEAKLMEERAKRLEQGFTDMPGPLSLRAERKLSYLLDEKDGGLNNLVNEATDELLALKEKLAVHDTIRARAIRKLTESDLNCFGGEGSGDDDREKCCQLFNEITTAWMQACNGLYKPVFLRALEAYKRLWSAQSYFLQYNMGEESFEAKKAEFKHLFVSTLATARPAIGLPSPLCKKDEPPKPFKKGLQEFDDVACQYYSKLELAFTTIETRCSRMTTTFEIDDYKLTLTEDLNKSKGIIPDAIISGSVDISLDIGSKGIGEWGPVEVEASAGIDLHIEFNKGGIKEVSATLGAKVSAGTEVIPKNPSAPKGGNAQVPVEGGKNSVSVEGKIGTITINSGSGVVGSGVLSGIKF